MAMEQDLISIKTRQVLRERMVAYAYPVDATKVIFR
jgi:hypothetical protein